MSLLSWLKKGSKCSLEVPNYPGLPNPNDEVNEEQALACESANKQIQEEMWNTSKQEEANHVQQIRRKDKSPHGEVF